ncbi:hypothetical protein MC885_014132 [Smutsia gigantea]|nr:hypothetical protein MC885_014132 [Smutsia gigantea]
MLALLLVLLPLPAGAWYKHGASSRYHTVGRAAGLLVGLRRSPYVWRRALRPAAAGPPAWATLGLGAPSRELSTRDTSLRGPPPAMPSCFPPSFRDCGRRDAGAPAQGSPSVRLRERVPEPVPAPQPRLAVHSWTSEEQASLRRAPRSATVCAANCLGRPPPRPTAVLSTAPACRTPVPDPGQVASASRARCPGQAGPTRQ